MHSVRLSVCVHVGLIEYFLFPRCPGRFQRVRCPGGHSSRHWRGPAPGRGDRPLRGHEQGGPAVRGVRRGHGQHCIYRESTRAESRLFKVNSYSYPK